MRLLLDTHALLWWLSGDARLGRQAVALVGEPEHDVLVSIVSLWEIQVKVRVGTLAADLREILQGIEAQSFQLLPVSPAHLVRLGTLPAHHRDPFDHLLIAQAIVEGLTFVSDDRHTPSYPVRFVPCS